MTITREQLELAALAAGHTINRRGQEARDAIVGRESASLWIDGVSTAWNPRRDDGDAARLAVRLNMEIEHLPRKVIAKSGGNAAWAVRQHDGTEPDKLRAWREAVMLCAAAVGERMKGGA